MKSIEQQIGDINADNAQERKRARRFWELSTAVFGDPAGQELLRMICRITDPLGSPMRGTQEETFCAIGRQEWIAALWRRSQPSIEAQDAPPPQHHASETTPTPDPSSPAAALASHFPGRCHHRARSDGGTDTAISDQCPGCGICRAPADPAG